MSSQLDPEILAAITAEARQCFLDEDAPEYLQMLENGIQDRVNPDYTELLRAAHSLKGGAGLASLASLQNLAHKLEDIILGIKDGQIEEQELAWALVETGINEVGYVLGQARTVDNALANPELIEALESLASTIVKEPESSGQDNGERELIHQALTTDLEDSLIVIEELDLDTPESVIEPVLTGLVDECTFLAENLELPWLKEAISPIAEVLTSSDMIEALLLSQQVIAQLRIEIADYLSQSEGSSHSPTVAVENYELIATSLNQELETICKAIMELAMDTPEEVIHTAISGFADECTFLGETLELPWLIEAVAPLEALVKEVEPLEALLTTQELVGEILQQRNLYLASLVETDRAEDEAVFVSESADSASESAEDEEIDEAEFFDFGEEEEEQQQATVMFAPPVVNAAKAASQIAATVPKTAPVSQVRIPLDRLQDMTNNVEEVILTYSRFNSQQKLLNQANVRLRSLTRQFEPIREQILNLYNQLAIGSSAINKKAGETDDVDRQNGNFDSLEMDQYTDLHGSLQSFQELMLQIQETRTDIDLVERELAEDIVQTQKNLDTLYSEVTESRLVPFDLLAKRFIPQIRGLSQRFEKLVDLKIDGKNTPVDQILLEQLQTPLTHLLNNAFDHGIESKYERLGTGKSETATIWLSSKIQRNSLIITIKDDGGGINIEKIYKRAVERGICPSNKSLRDFEPGEILNWIFEPNFSTAAKVSDLSGRGMGLDIVLNLIRQLKGQIQIQTDVGLGTTFTISLPVNLSLQSLMIVQLQNQIIAIPHTSILEILPAAELDFDDLEEQSIRWQQQVIALSTANSLFPRPRRPFTASSGKVAMVLQTAFAPVAILVDNIVTEDKLIVKPFDETIPVPSYMAGCTVLGTGQVVPVVLPLGLEQAAIASGSRQTESVTVANVVSTILVAEDSVATRKMLDKILTSVGYNVIACRDGQDALEQVNGYQGKIDLIISDIEMPRLNGFELLAQVRSQPAFKNTPIVMATSRTGDRHKQEAQRLGATDYLGKPVQPQALIDTVAELLAKR